MAYIWFALGDELIRLTLCDVRPRLKVRDRVELAAECEWGGKSGGLATWDLMQATIKRCSLP